MNLQLHNPTKTIKITTFFNFSIHGSQFFHKPIKKAKKKKGIFMLQKSTLSSDMVEGGGREERREE